MKNRFSLFYILLICIILPVKSQKLVKLWETEPILKVPESVVWDKKNKKLYFSNIDGEANTKDGKGSIGRMDPDGKNIEVEWIRGLNAPKGMGIRWNALDAPKKVKEMQFDELLVADVDSMVEISLESGKHYLFGLHPAVFLNDVSISNKGDLYVSDMVKGEIQMVCDSGVYVIIDGQRGVNGVLAVKDDLYFLRSGTLWKLDPQRKLTKIAEGMDTSTDGLEQTRKGNFIVTCWNGIMYYVTPGGNKTVLLDTREQKKNAADIGFNAEENIIYVPTFYGNTIAAYKLKE